MLSKTRIALSLAIVLGTASAAMAASNHPVHHRVAVESQQSGASAYGSVRSTNTDPAANSASVIAAQKREAAGDPRCWGGNCDPNWNSSSID